MPKENCPDIVEILSRGEHIEGIICCNDISKELTDAIDHARFIVVVDFPISRDWSIVYQRDSSLGWPVIYISYDKFEYHLQHYDDVWFYEMIISGHLLFDRTGRLHRSLEESYSRRNEYLRLKMMADFSILLKKYYMSQYYYRACRLLDAYHQLLDSVIYWARMVIYNSGQIPRDNVLDQVYGIDVGIYKLYEELATTREPLIKQIELMQLVYLHQVLSKTRYYTEPLLKIFEEADEPLTFYDIKNHLRFPDTSIELHILLDEMVKRGYIQRMLIHINDVIGLYEELYKLNR